MDIEERLFDDVTILDLKGKMTLGEGDELLKDAVNRLLAADRRKILLNLEDVPYIDSAGLGEIVRTYTTVSRQGGRIWLCYLTNRIHDLLSLTKLLTVFEFVQPEEVVGNAADDRFVASCPICRPTTWITLRAGPEYHSCSVCGVDVKLASWPSPVPNVETEIACAIVRLPTYDDEHVRLVIAEDELMVVEGRLDLFASEVVEQMWLLLPLPRRAIFSVRQNAFTDAGLQALLELCMTSPTEDRSAIAITGVTDETRYRLPKHPAVHDGLDQARGAVGSCGTQIPGIRLRVRRA